MRPAHPLTISLVVALTLTACDQPGADASAYRYEAPSEVPAITALTEGLATEAVARTAQDLARWRELVAAPPDAPPEYPPAPEDATPSAPPECSGALPWMDAPPVTTDLTPGDLSPFDHLGMRVAVFGGWLVAGVDGDDGASLDDGAVRVWRREAAGWNAAGQLSPTRVAPEAHFGWDVAIHRDRVAVAAPGATVSDFADAGAVELFAWTAAAGWASADRVAAPQPSLGARFGETVALGADRLVVGAPGELAERGAVYVFASTGAGWELEARLITPAPATGDLLGTSVAEDRGVVVAGAPEARDGDGAAWVFERTAAGWGPARPLIAPGVAPGARFGGAVAVARGLVLVGADEDSPGALDAAGSVTVFALVDGAWRVRTRLLDLVPAAGAHFGAGLRFDGAIAAVGAWSGAGAAAQTGAVMLFAPAKGGWARLARLTDPSGLAGDRLGVGVALGDGVVAAGAWASDGVAVDAGRLLVFEYGGCDPTASAAARE
ncbi:MAG: hypothetical protein CVU56_01355 [Deltaproteobacteria bacterium HGW-Deltaproteobacteria-14]|nr:MAG: hypothetical protein CVU56_01355 [Deltaproteobacteria bacterium HGW-Deltaproteobacteria-14]